MNKRITTQYDRCGHCGFPWSIPDASWPRTCSCGGTTWRNPIPVAVLLVPLLSQSKILGVRRNINPGKGLPALPEGFLETGETWRPGAARELLEESSGTIIVDPSFIQVFAVETPPTNLNVTLIFCSAPPIAGIPENFVPNAEVSELLVLSSDMELAFSLHTDVMRKYMESR